MRRIVRGYDNPRYKDQRNGQIAGAAIAILGGALAVWLELHGYSANKQIAAKPQVTPSELTTDRDTDQTQDPDRPLRSILLDCRTYEPLLVEADSKIGTNLRKAPDIKSAEIKPALPAKELVEVNFVLQIEFPEGTEFWAKGLVETKPNRRVVRGLSTTYALLATQQDQQPMIKEMNFNELGLLKCEPVSDK